MHSTYLKRGRCTAFNTAGFSELANKSFAAPNRYRFQFEAEHLMFQGEEIYFGARQPFKASHKDVGFEMQIFEGNLRDFRPIVYENFGYDVGIHNPNEAVDETALIFTVSLNRSYLFFVTPQLTTIDESLISMSPIE